MKYPNRIDIPIERVEEATSTNNYLAQLCRESKAQEFYTVIADHQSAGKGQRGNTWESEKGKNLLCSMVLYPTALEVKEQFYISKLVAVSIIDALNKYTDGFSVKWPNDIYWKDKKIAGILIENELTGKYLRQCIIGIGLNVNQEEFHSNAPNPVSLKQIISVDVNIQEIFEKVIHGIVSGYRLLEENFGNMAGTIDVLYFRNLYRRNGYYPYRDNNGPFMAQFHNMEPDGHIYLRDDQGKIRRYAFKEVEFILPHE